MKNFNLKPLLGGAGLRHEHFEAIIEQRPPFRWFEVISENFMGFGGAAQEALQEIRKSYQIIGHGVCTSIGSTDPLDMTYLKEMRIFLDEINSPWASDHLCFTKVDHTNLNDLIPIPFTEESAQNCIERLKIIQNELGRPFMFENVTRYMTVSDREMSEAEFINRIVDRSGCGLLLDITNAYLNSNFHKYDALEFIKSLPLDHVGQVHLAGWEPEADGKIIDSHDAPVPKQVWDLFREFTKIAGPSSVLVEWDSLLPSVDRLLEETVRADKLIAEVTGTVFEMAA